MEPEIFRRKGGTWLGAVRNWVKWHVIGGDRLIWGTDDKKVLLTTHGGLNLVDIEEIAFKAGFAVLERSVLKLEGYLKHLQGELLKVDVSKINLEINMGWEEHLAQTVYERRIKDMESLIRQLREDI